jgi:hypothetical protein
VGLYTDADSLFHAKTDKQYQLLLNNRKLDAESAAMRKNIQKLSADVETKMAEVETHLQRMWNVQRRKEKKVLACYYILLFPSVCGSCLTAFVAYARVRVHRPCVCQWATPSTVR